MIDRALLNAYVGELEALRVHGRELAECYPDVAARLDIGPRRSRDPHVERLIQSAAFIAARLRLDVENQSAELPTALLSTLAPTLLEPVPAMAIAELRGGSEAERVPRGTRFDLRVGRYPLVCMSTTMDITAAPLSIRVKRLKAQDDYADGISLGLTGKPPTALRFYVGNNALNAATLLDAFADHLALVEVIRPGGDEVIRLPPDRVRILGFGPDEAALPVRPAVHQAHRLVTEFIAFPEKFNFVSLTGAAFEHGSEIRFRFSKPLPLDRELPGDLITVNRVPVVNLWASAGTPFNITGKQLEYPVRVDAQRYRIVECHSVEDIQFFGADSSKPIRLDPLLATGDVRGGAIRWGTRRTVSPDGGEVVVYFKELDYRKLGQQSHLVAPRVLASNGDLPRRARVGDALHPDGGLGDWRATLATVPTAYRPALVQADAMRTLISYMQSSLTSLASNDSRGSLRHYLRQFPGADSAAWIDAIGRVAVRPIATTRNGIPQPGQRVFIGFDSTRSRSTSSALVERLVQRLLDSQRGLNRVEDVVVVTA